MGALSARRPPTAIRHRTVPFIVPPNLLGSASLHKCEPGFSVAPGEPPAAFASIDSVPDHACTRVWIRGCLWIRNRIPDVPHQRFSVIGNYIKHALVIYAFGLPLPVDHVSIHEPRRYGLFLTVGALG